MGNKLSKYVTGFCKSHGTQHYLHVIDSLFYLL